MKWPRWIEQPRLLALLTVAFALVPAWLATVTYSDGRQKDERLYDTTAQVLAEQLQRGFERHLYFLGVLRNQARTLDNSALFQGQMTPVFDWKTHLPHLVAFGYAEQDHGRLVLRWKSQERTPVEFPGSPAMAAALKADRSATLACPAGKHGLMVLEPVYSKESPTVPRGYVVGWLNLESLCGDPALPLVGEQVLRALPLLETDPTPAGARRVTVREGRAQWAAAIARGPRFSQHFGAPTPWLAFLAVGLSTVPLLLLVGLAGRASKLRADLSAERELLRQQRFFTQSVSHEFRTPLSIILSGAELLESYHGQLTAARQHEVLKEIKDNTLHMTAMIEDVLLLGRMQSSRHECDPKPVHLLTLCGQIVRRLRATTADARVINLSAPDRQALLDAALLSTILDNLLSNALKYSSPDQPVSLEVIVHRETITFSVRDQGIGIPAAELARVCDPFHRCGNVGEVSGNGLGLAIAQSSAALHGGKLTLESLPGRSTTASLTVPFNPAP